MKNAGRILAVLALAVMLPAFTGLAADTADGGGRGKTSYSLNGTITGLDGGARTLTVEVATPASLVKDNPLTVQTTSDTKFKQCDLDGMSYAIEFDDLETGRLVRITAVLDGDAYMATLVVQH